MIPFLQSTKTFLSQTEAIAAAFSTPPTAARKTLINNTVSALLSSGIWQLCDLIYFLAAADNQAATINWKNPGTNTLTENNSPTFNADRGYTGDGVSMYLSTDYTNNLYTQNNAHIAAFGMTNGNNVSIFALNIAGPNFRAQVKARNTTSSQISVSTGTPTNAVTGGTVPLLVGGDRIDASNQTLYANGTVDVVGAVASVSITMVRATFLQNGVDTLFSTEQVAFGCCGASLGDTGHSMLNSIVRGYLLAVGAI